MKFLLFYGTTKSQRFSALHDFFVEAGLQYWMKSSYIQDGII